MVTIINTHEVKDFNAWKIGFEAGAEVRARAGVTLKNLFRDTDNPNKVTVVCEMGDTESAKAFIANLRQVLEKSGVVGEPNIMILEHVN
ncbi:hypothetical protein [Polluticoccus soli]|uniref:hypothetical protein n=1 Tax=Polluticoccus soli TaxID=3034150 RepID=UPI0023E31A39|nr:hypothetical protein [Flavipsychrobacter sp. JY13-12]